MTDGTRELLSPADLADELGVPTGTLADWRSRGIGPAYLRIGKHARYRRADVDRWLDSRRHETEKVTTP